MPSDSAGSIKKRSRASADHGRNRETDSFVELAPSGSAWLTETQPDEDVEFWLVKMPSKFKLENLDGKSCTIQQKGRKRKLADEKRGISLNDGSTCTIEDVGNAECRQYLNAFYDSSDHKWSLGKPFARQLNVMDAYSFPTEKLGPAINPVPPRHLLENLTSHFYPAGAEKPDGDANTKLRPDRSTNRPNRDTVTGASKLDNESKNQKKEKKEKKAKKEKKKRRKVKE